MLSATRAGCRCAILLSAVACLTAPALASPAPPDSVPVLTGPLTLERALELTRHHAGSLRAARLRAEAARARIADAGRRPNPTLAATEENFGGRLGTRLRETTVSVSQVLERGGDRRARVGVAEAERRKAVAELATLQQDALAETADRFIATWTLQARLGRMRAGVTMSARAVEAAKQRFAAGASARVEILRAQDRAALRDVALRLAESELEAARTELALALGAAAPTFDSLVAPTDTLAGWSGVERRGLAMHPDAARAASEEALAAARVAAAMAERRSDVTVSAGVRRLEERRGTGIVIGAELPLPLWNRGRGGVIAARDEAEAAATERRATERRLSGALEIALMRARSAAAVLDTLRLRVHPARVRIVDELFDSYRAGRSNYLDLAAEESGLLETELALIDARVDLWRTQIRLEQLTAPGRLTPREAR